MSFGMSIKVSLHFVFVRLTVTWSGYCFRISLVVYNIFYCDYLNHWLLKVCIPQCTVTPFSRYETLWNVPKSNLVLSSRCHILVCLYENNINHGYFIRFPVDRK